MLFLTVERERQKLSKSELARRSGIGLAEISRIESGKIYPYPGWRKRLAKALGVAKPDCLFEVIKNE